MEAFGGEGIEDVIRTPKVIETGLVSTKVPMQMMEDIDRLLASGYYLRVFDYLIDLIRKDMQSRGEGFLND